MSAVSKTSSKGCLCVSPSGGNPNRRFAKHRNPHFSKTLGVTLPHTETVDILHTLHSGIFAEYCKHTVWQVLGAEIWGDGTMTHEEKLHVCVLALRTQLGTWYAVRSQSHPHETLTQVHDLTLKVLGTGQHPKHKLSATETWGLALFCADACVKFVLLGPCAC